MKAYALGDRNGGALTLHRVERPDLVPGPGEFVVRVRATGLGARDLSILKSAWPPARKRFLQNPPPPERIRSASKSCRPLHQHQGLYRW